MAEDEGEVKLYAYEGSRADGEVAAVTAGEEPKVLTQEVTLLGARHGAGKATFPNGDKYTGEFCDGLRSGTGAYTYAAMPPPEEGEEPKPPVAEFEGKFLAGAKSGVGQMLFSDGAKYHGSFAAGKYEGQGTMFYANGDIYTGEWLAGLKHGAGAYIYKETGATLTGSWSENVLVEGTFVDKYGNAYAGAFDADASSCAYVPGNKFSLVSGATYQLPLTA